MEFRDLKAQYLKNKDTIDSAIQDVLLSAQFIGGKPVQQLEDTLAKYVGVKHCITCANGTDALQLALMAWDIGQGDAIFVPDFTFFSTAEVIPWTGATPVFVDVDADTFNISLQSLEEAIQIVKREGKLCPKAIIAVDLFGQPADWTGLREIAQKYDVLLLEDGAQGFGGSIADKMACSFGDVSTTSFFPAKPLGCYGDGGAIFTDNDEWAERMRSYKVHGKGADKYDNIRIGMNSRLDTLQAAILLAKFDKFVKMEIAAVNHVAEYYNDKLMGIVEIPITRENHYSTWAQYTIKLQDKRQRDLLQKHLKENKIPSMIYYAKPLHRQTAFSNMTCNTTIPVAERLCDIVLSLPIHPYLCDDEIEKVCKIIREFLHSE